MIKIKEVRDLGAQLVANDYKMVGQDGAYSIELSDSTLFYFGDTLIGEREENKSLWYIDGEPVGPKDMSGRGTFEKMINNTGLITKQKDLSFGLRKYDYITEEDQLKQLVPLRDDEDPDWIRIWCLHGIEIEDKLYLFYIKVKTIEEGVFPVNFEIIGSGVAVGNKKSWEFERLNFNGDDMIWKADQPHFAPVALKGNDGYVYLYGVLQDEAKIQNCYLAKCKINAIEDFGSYEYFDAESGTWSKDINRISPVFSGMPNELSVSYNEYLQKYIAVFSLDLTGKIIMKTSENPWGPWNEEPVLLHQVLVNRKYEIPYPTLIYAGKEHPMLSKNNGKTIYVTYIEFEEYFPHLLEITFE